MEIPWHHANSFIGWRLDPELWRNTAPHPNLAKNVRKNAQILIAVSADVVYPRCGLSSMPGSVCLATQTLRRRLHGGEFQPEADNPAVNHEPQSTKNNAHLMKVTRKLIKV